MKSHHIFSKYGKKSSQPSPVSLMMSEFAKDFRPGIDINLGVGYVNEETIPYDEFAEIVNILAKKDTRLSHLLNYGGPEGSVQLIESIKWFYQELWKDHRIGNIPNFNERQIIIGVSGATSILTGLANILRKGIVITTDPVYYIYTSTLERYGFEIAPVQEEMEGPDINILVEVLEKHLKQGKHVSFCYFVSVNNPTCTVISNRRRREIVECVQNLAKKYNVHIPIIFDLAYEWLIHNPELEKPVSPSIYDNNASVYEIGTLSKIFAPSLRVGFIIGPQGSDLLKALVQWNSDVGFSAPLITQEVSAELIKRYGKKQFNSVNDGYRKKGTLFKREINQQIGNYLESITGGDAGFYLYLTFKEIKTISNSRLFTLLSRNSGVREWDYEGKEKKPKVIYLPGIYCVSSQRDMLKKGKYQMRLSYGYESIDKLLQSVHIIKKALFEVNRNFYD
ncbi:MAG: pyridoxal phosphate-dependent aminotransferase [Candidatus Hydrogenedens sp.]